MEIVELGISGVWLATFTTHSDSRGNFREWFKIQEIHDLTGFRFEPNQANISTSTRGVIRGIHYSLAPQGQAKWITCTSGSIRDVIVDIRIGSPTYGQWISVDLTASDGKAIFIEPGLGHGFSSFEDNTNVCYLLSTSYSPKDEFAISPLDEELDIDWGFKNKESIISDKDLAAPSLKKQFEESMLPTLEEFG